MTLVLFSLADGPSVATEMPAGAAGSTANAEGFGFPAAEPGAEILAVNVNGTRVTPVESYENMLHGLAAFERWHKLAPRAAPRFVLIPQSGSNVSEFTSGAALRLVGGEAPVDVPILADGVFSLPQAASSSPENISLVLNKKKGLFRLWSYVHSPDVPKNSRRLGDLRLECEVLWEIYKPKAPFFIRSYAAIAGGLCSSHRANIFYPVAGQLAAVTMIYGDRRETLHADFIGKDGRNFRPPIDDKTWPDDTLLEFALAETAPSQKADQ